MFAPLIFAVDVRFGAGWLPIISLWCYFVSATMVVKRPDVNTALPLVRYAVRQKWVIQCLAERFAS
jgi:hypothetical protein